MMKFLLKTGLIALLLHSVLIAPVHAMTVLTESELKSICTVDVEGELNNDGPCSIYVRGFIDGAIATDPRVTMNVIQELEKESFSERAARTRIGNRLDRYGPSVFAEFCVPQPVPLSDITNHVVNLLLETDAGNDPARETVYRVLKKHYPCE